MYKIKQSLDAVNYGAYFYEGRALTMEEIVDRAADMGYDAVDIWPHRPLCFPLDYSKDQRKRLLDYANNKNIKFVSIDAATNYMRTDHALVPKMEKELLYVKECCELAQDLDCPVVRILPAFIGYFWNEHWDQGYGNIAMHSRTLEVSKLEDYLVEWDSIRAGIIDSGKIASDYGVELAVQGHPPVVNCVQDLIDLVDEVNMPNVKIGLDLPLFESQEDEYIRDTVLKVGDKMIHSHTLGVIMKSGPSGQIYASEEVVPGDGIENWVPFMKACKEINYQGYFAYEQCAPFLMPGHTKPDLAEFDRRQQVGFDFIKSLEDLI
ncbi:MAG: sugar phosphate isomerase/epimerase [Anaerolineaceae bacterium]|nr:sugar phosphate isomerase/epimerase [Anaerolineaceae bacterium]